MNPNDNSYKSYNLEASFNFSQEDLRELFNQTKLGHGRHFSEVTIKNYLADISHLGDWFVKEFHRPATAQEVTAEILKLFKDYLSGKKYSPRTIERHLSSIRTLFKVLKKQGIVAKDPTQKPAVDIEQKDAWHIRQFKDYLYVFGAADLTIKNYITDLRHFLGWVDQAVLASDFNSAEQYRFEKLIEVLPLYRQRLVKITNLAPASIKRKLSGIRKFLLWSAKEGFIRKELVETPRVPTAKPAVAAPVVLPAPNQAW
ncbi:site-specific integrase, partial [Candidatus Microgenomates bacterium]|nr:site-specific integrase [Candidatus Microgenomates bacterium]